MSSHSVVTPRTTASKTACARFAAINLASEPFRRERAQNAIYAGVCFGLLCIAVILSGLLLHARKQARYLRHDIQREQAQVDTLQRDQSRYSSVLARPENADVFSRSVFLNELIARRSVSWAHVFSDLQTVMPNTVRLEAIRLPQIPAQDAGGTNHVQLDMVVGTERPEAFLDLLKRLQASSLFGAASVITQAPPTQNDPLYKYRVTVAYAQKL